MPFTTVFFFNQRLFFLGHIINIRLKSCQVSLLHISADDKSSEDQKIDRPDFPFNKKVQSPFSPVINSTSFIYIHVHNLGTW